MSRLNTRLPRKLALGAALAFALGAASPAAHADFGGWQTTGFMDQSNLKTVLADLLATGTNIREMASTVNGGWIIVTDSPNQTVYWGGDVPSLCLTKVYEYIQSGREIDCIAFTPSNGWMVIAEDLAWHAGTLSYVPELEAAILDRIAAGKRLTELVFDSDAKGWTLLSNGGKWAQTISMPDDLYAAVLERHAHDRSIQRIQMDGEGNWVLFAEDWFASRGIDTTCFEWIKDFQRVEHRLDNVMLGPGGAWALFSHAQFAPDLSNTMQYMEYGLAGVGGDGSHVSNIWQRMEDLDIAGVSIGVIENDRLRWARGYGVLENGTQRWVRTDSPFDTASVSKTVATTLFMNMCDDPGINLNIDMNLKQAALGGPVVFWNDLLVYLLYGNLYKGYNLPFTQITLRRLLSHTAAMVPHGSTEFFPGDATPSTLEILFGANGDGMGGMSYGGSNMPYYQSDLFSDGGFWLPGQTYKYSGGGFMVAQAMAETVTDNSFHVLMQQRVLSPLGMADSTYVQPLPPGFDGRVALPHDDAGVVLPVGQRPFYPWESAGGLYSTPTDLSQVILTLMNQGTHPQLGVEILEPGTTNAMMLKQTPPAESKLYGLGLMLSQSVVNPANQGWFAHDGGHGEACAWFAGSPGRGEGVVILINGGGDDPETLRNELYAAFKKHNGWN